MATVPLRALLNLVRPHIPQAPDYMAAHHLRLAAIEFCERTKCWRHIVTKPDHLAGETDLEIPDYASLHEIEFAEIDGLPLTPVAFTDVTVREYDKGAHPRYITQTEPNLLTILPDADGAVTVSMFLKPATATNTAWPPTTSRTHTTMFPTISCSSGAKSWWRAPLPACSPSRTKTGPT